MKRQLLIACGIASLVVIALVGVRSPLAAEGAVMSSTGQPAAREQVIEHLQPRRDSVGALPEKYEWTAIKGADSYSIGLWNEVDQMIFRQDDLRSTTFIWPRESKLDMGTYFWSVTAWSKGRAIAGSGLAAFVINR